jgi:hypothetical protein
MVEPPEPAPSAPETAAPAPEAAAPTPAQEGAILTIKYEMGGTFNPLELRVSIDGNPIETQKFAVAAEETRSFSIPGRGRLTWCGPWAEGSECLTCEGGVGEPVEPIEIKPGAEIRMTCWLAGRSGTCCGPGE